MGSPAVLGLCVWLRRLSRWRAQVLYALYCVSCAHLLSQLDTHMYPLSTTQVLVFYRLPILCTVMAWLWAGNILFCSRWGVSVHALFRMRSAAAAGHHHDRDGDAAAARTVVHIAIVFTAATAAALALRVWGTELVDGTPRPYYQAALHPFGVHALLLGLLFCPMRVLCPDGRWAVCRALIRTVTAPAREVTFADIIFADCLTSMARGLSALEVVFCLSAAPQTEPTYGSHVMSLSPHCSKANVFPLVLELSLNDCVRAIRSGSSRRDDGGSVLVETAAVSAPVRPDGGCISTPCERPQVLHRLSVDHCGPVWALDDRARNEPGGPAAVVVLVCTAEFLRCQYVGRHHGLGACS